MALPTVGAVFGVFFAFFVCQKKCRAVIHLFMSKMFRRECLGLVEHIYFLARSAAS